MVTVRHQQTPANIALLVLALISFIVVIVIFFLVFDFSSQSRKLRT